MSIRKWWDDLHSHGPDYGYYPNPQKTHLLVKVKLLDKAMDLFQNTEIVVCRNGIKYLSAAIRIPTFVKSFLREKVNAWVNEVKSLLKIAIDQAQATCAAFTHSIKSHWNYLMRTMPEIETEIQLLEGVI